MALSSQQSHRLLLLLCSLFCHFPVEVNGLEVIIYHIAFCRVASFLTLRLIFHVRNLRCSKILMTYMHSIWLPMHDLGNIH